MNTQNPTQAILSDELKRIKHGRKRVYVYALILFLIAAIIGTYVWQHNKVRQLSRQLNSLSSSTGVPVAQGNGGSTSPATSTGYTTDVGVGYPLALQAGKVLTTISLPAGLNVYQYDQDIKTQSQLAGLYTESLNDILGRWFFMPKGTMANPSQPDKSGGQIFVSAMSQWQDTDDTAVVYYPASYAGTGSKLTIAQKQAFVSNLKKQTAACAGDADKGFATKDKVYNVCYTLRRPQAKGGDWVLSLSGYGEVSGMPVYLGGFADLPATTYQNALTAYIRALENISIKVETR